ncbi:MAG TPA: DUF2889 domain-containing protein [Acidimicrobiales bacterium]|nr:DUF2889 domain-containing protein [Acidimicrobiales bacterium]
MTEPSTAPGAVPVHRRTMELDAFDEGDQILVLARLRDRRPWVDDGPGAGEVHDMELRVRVRRADLTILECRADMHTFPHAECPAVEAAFAGLVGRRVTRGFTKTVQSLVSGPKGCAHLDQLARAVGPVVVQALTSSRARRLREGRVDDLLSSTPDAPWPRGTCHVWAVGGVAEQKLAAGWRPGLGPYPAPPLDAIRSGSAAPSTPGTPPGSRPG